MIQHHKKRLYNFVKSFFNQVNQLNLISQISKSKSQILSANANQIKRMFLFHSLFTSDKHGYHNDCNCCDTTEYDCDYCEGVERFTADNFI